MKQKQMQEVQRVMADSHTGLSSQQVQARMEAGAHNGLAGTTTLSIQKIILKNIFTPFNIINFLLALAILLVGHPRNALFFGIALANTIMNIVQELRAKKTLDALSILARGQVRLVRDGSEVQVPQQDVVLDDIMLLQAGNQVCADAQVLEAEGLEMDESLLTGEADHIRKEAGGDILSGSFVVAGSARVRVTAVGSSSYAGKLSVQAKQHKKQNAQLMKTLNTIIRVLAVCIVPIGLLLFFTQYNHSNDLGTSVLGAAAAMVGMIPEGLVLLTGITLTLGALKLAKRKALVQSLPSIETLARADVLCLDKTGTITDGTLTFEQLQPLDGVESTDAQAALREMMAGLQDENSTAKALRAAFPGGGAWQVQQGVPFSSARKWSAAAFAGQGSYVLGAPSFVFPAMDAALQSAVAQHTQKGLRVLCLAHSASPLGEGDALPQNLRCMGLVVMSDTIRPNAAETFRAFEAEGVTLKVISGDDALTVSSIAQNVGIKDAGKYIDLSGAPENMDYSFLTQRYTVFGRVTPEQKRHLVAALKRDGHTVCMTGDGVNDVLAMKEADCGVAMINGSEAARGAADFVLMSSDFSVMTQVLQEGRRVINNIESVASLYLVKTIYSTILSLLYVFIPYPYPFAPLQMTPINALTVGIPSFFLAMRPDYQKPQGRFLANVLENSAPAALAVVFNILVIQLAGYCFGLSQAETSTMNVLLTAAVGFRLLYRVMKPEKAHEYALLVALAVGFVCVLLLFGDFFMLGSPFTRNMFFYVPLIYIGAKLFSFLSRQVRWAEKKLAERNGGSATE